MHASPDAAAVQGLLDRVHRRAVWINAVYASGMLLAAAAIVVLILNALEYANAVASGLGVALAGSGVATLFALRVMRVPERLVEERAPGCRNLVITAAELLRSQADVHPDIRRRVLHDAAAVIPSLDLKNIVPARRAVATLSFGALFLAAATVGVASEKPLLPDAIRLPNGAARVDAVDVTVVPPAYRGGTEQTFRDPARIDAVEGSLLRVRVRALASALIMETISGSRPFERATSGEYRAELRADGNGFIAFEAQTGGVVGPRRLIALRVTADPAPAVKVTAPARDLFFADASAVVPVTITASDDHALGALALRYTKVSGSGEQFTFTEGSVPLTIERSSDTMWKGTATLRLADFALGAGDMIVYRGVASDRRPAASATESDAYIIEITAPGSIPMEGFSAEDEDRYALSQQMVIMKTERLIARARSLPADSVEYEALTIAAEQRSVRAEFVFMMGGELAEEVLAEASMSDLDETSHAEADDEAIAGRLANRGRVSLLVAIRSMSRASTALTEGNLERALAEERNALDNLQQAFSRTRYILRSLTRRESLDLTRRLSGDLSAASSSAHALPAGASDTVTAALRAVLFEVAGQGSAPDARHLSVQAMRLLELGLDAARPIAARLDSAAHAASAGQPSAARAQLERSVQSLAALVRTRLGHAPGAGSSIHDARVGAVLLERLRGTPK